MPQLATVWFHIRTGVWCEWVVVERGLLELRTKNPIIVRSGLTNITIEYGWKGHHSFQVWWPDRTPGIPDGAIEVAMSTTDLASLMLILKQNQYKAVHDDAPNKSQQLTLKFNSLITPADLDQEIKLLHERQGK